MKSRLEIRRVIRVSIDIVTSI